MLSKRLFNWAAEVAVQDHQPQQVLQASLLADDLEVIARLDYDSGLCSVFSDGARRSHFEGLVFN